MVSNNDFRDDTPGFDDVSEGADGEDFQGGGTTLGELWRNNPLVKIGVIAGGLMTVIGAVVLFGGQGEQALPSRVTGAADVSQAPGTGPISEAYKEALEEGNEQRTETAIREGGSAIPTPVDTAVSRLTIPEDETVTEDPLERWRRIQEERQQRTVQRAPEAPTANPHAAAIDALSQAMAAQMESILGTKKPVGPEHQVVTDVQSLDEEKAAAGTAGGTGGSGGTAAEEDIINIIIPAGEIEYAQLITEANSDVPGPILAQLASGPLAGSRLIGTFEVEEEYLVLSFNTIVVDGIQYPTEAVAIDPDTTMIGMATDVDKRYFSRIILPAAASFIEGMGEAIADTGSTTTIGDTASTTSSPELNTREELFKGVEEAAKTVGDILTEDGEDVEPLIRVEVGTPMGILFVQPVTDETM